MTLEEFILNELAIDDGIEWIDSISIVKPETMEYLLDTECHPYISDPKELLDYIDDSILQMICSDYAIGNHRVEFYVED